MCFALYAARDAHAMRHYDVKLLNFLLADFEASSSTTATTTTALEDEAAAALFSPGSAAAAAVAAHKGQQQQQRQQGKGQGEEGGAMAVRYGLGPHVYRLTLPADKVRREGRESSGRPFG